MRFLHRVTTRKGFVDLHNHTNRSYSYKEIEHIYLTPCSYLYEVKEYVDKFGYLCSLVYAIAASASIYMPILSRLEFYFSLPFICLIGNMTARLPHVSRRLLMVLISLICIAFFLISTPGGTLAIDNYELTIK